MSERPKHWDPDELEMNKAVYLAVYERDPATRKPLTQDKIAERLGTTREQVNRYLQRAKQQGVLCSEYVPPSDEMQDRVVLELNYTDVAKVLRDFARYHREDNEGQSIQSVTVVCEELPCNHDGSWDDSLLRFGPLTAVKTKQFIRDVARFPTPTLGLAWGRILRCVTDAVSAHDFAGVRGKSSVHCVPLWGEVWGPEVMEWKGTVFIERERLSSSTLARDLEAKLNRRADSRKRHSLEAVPVMLPRELVEHKGLLYRYLERVSAWGEVFGERRIKRGKGDVLPLADHLQLVLAAAGSTKNPGRFLSPEVLKNVLTEKEAAHLLRVVYGDVAGVLMEKPKLSRADRTFLDGLHACWTGVKEEHLRECAGKACAGKAVGVVVYAIDKSCARPILEAIRRGLVSHLVTEMGLAAEMKRLAEQAMSGSRKAGA